MIELLLTGIVGVGVGLVWLGWSTRPRVRTTSVRATEWNDALTRAGLGRWSHRALIGASAAIGCVVGILLLAMTATPALAACAMAMAAWSPWLFVRSRVRRRDRELRAAWPDAVDHLISAVRAGMSLPDAVSNIAIRGPVPLRPQFAAFAADYRATGRFDESLLSLKERLADPVADRIIEALRVTRQVGGTDLVTVLRTLASFLREEAKTRGEIEARQAWVVTGARIAVAAPWLVLAALTTRPEGASTYNSPTGTLVIALGAVCCLVAYRLMMRIGALPSEARVLR